MLLIQQRIKAGDFQSLYSPAKEELNMEKDLTKKNCLMDNERYADLINGLIFQGKQVLQAEDLLDMDSQTGIWSKFGVRGKWQRN